MRLNNCIRKISKDGVYRVRTSEETLPWIYKKINELNLSKKFQLITGIGFNADLKTATSIYPVGWIGYKYLGEHKTTFGKGFTPAQSMASTLMEFAERYSFMDNIDHILSPEFKCSVNQLKNNLRDMSYETFEIIRKSNYDFDVIPDHQFDFYKGYDVSGNVVYLPLKDFFQKTDSNGMGTGNTFEEAVLHGITEVIERHCRTQLTLKKLPAPIISVDSIDDPACIKLIEDINRFQYKIVKIIDSSLDMSIPTIAVIWENFRGKLSGTWGTGITKEEALIRALLETIQLMSPASVDYSEFDLSQLNNSKTISFQEIPNFYNQDILEEIRYIDKQLRKQGKYIFIFDTTHPELNVPSAYVCITNTRCDYEGTILDHSGTTYEEIIFKYDGEK